MATTKKTEKAAAKKAAAPKVQHIGLVKNDPWLEPFEGAICGRHEHALYKLNELTQGGKQTLSDFASGNLSDSHVFNLGKPGEILKNCGFPPHDRIELSAARLRMKAEQGNHPFDFMDITGLDKALQNPIAVFEYGDKTKSQNVIVNLEKDGKDFLVGVFFNQQQRGYEVSDIRGLFNRDNMDWIRWIQHGKMIYGDKDKTSVEEQNGVLKIKPCISKEWKRNTNKNPRT